MSKKIIIDAGHGGSDPGASGNEIIEKDLTLKISQYMKKRFDELGIPNSMTRNSDVTLNPTDRVNKVLSFYGNGSDVIVLSNHINAGGGDGFEVVYGLRNNDTLARKMTEEIEQAGQNVRKYYQRRLPSDSSKDYYYIIRNTPNTEALLIEYGFLDSDKDDVEQLKNNYERYAEAIVKAVSEYAGYTYKNNTSNYYTVKSGDSLWSIAKKYNTTVDKIKSLNNLSSNLLQIGQNLIINEGIENNADSPNYYTVKKGDSLYSIAKNFNTTVDKIKSLNNLSSSLLSINQKLLIPQTGLDENNFSNTYIVKSGDTLYSIAKKYNITVDKIKSLNNLLSNTLSIGQKLILDGDENNITYIVKKGDTLYSIARMFNKQVSDIINNNNLSSTILSIGQKLII